MIMIIFIVTIQILLETSLNSKIIIFFKEIQIFLSNFISYDSWDKEILISIQLLLLYYYFLKNFKTKEVILFILDFSEF
jgi:hypothetical protein